MALLDSIPLNVELCGQWQLNETVETSRTRSSHVLIRVVEPRELLVGGGDLGVRRRPRDVEQAVELVVPRAAVVLRVFFVVSAAVIAVAPVVVEVVAGRHIELSRLQRSIT